jgi:hypothetical protein
MIDCGLLSREKAQFSTTLEALPDWNGRNLGTPNLFFGSGIMADSGYSKEAFLHVKVPKGANTETILAEITKALAQNPIPTFPGNPTKGSPTGSHDGIVFLMHQEGN